MFYYRNDAGASKVRGEKRCFTIETAVGGRKGRWCPSAVAAMFGLWSAMFGPVRHREVHLQIVRGLITVGSRWHWIVGGGAVLLGSVNADGKTPRKIVG